MLYLDYQYFNLLQYTIEPYKFLVKPHKKPPFSSFSLATKKAPDRAQALGIEAALAEACP